MFLDFNDFNQWSLCTIEDSKEILHFKLSTKDSSQHKVKITASPASIYFMHVFMIHWSRGNCFHDVIHTD